MNTKTLDIIGITFIAQNVALISAIHVLRMCGVERQPAQADRLARSAEEHPLLSDMIGVERQPAQADRLARSAEEHPLLSDMIGTQTGFRMKTIIGMSVMSAQKRAMLEYIFGIMAL